MTRKSPYRAAPDPRRDPPDLRYVRTWRRRYLIAGAALLSIVAGVALPGWPGIAVGVLGVGVFGNWFFLFTCPRCASPFAQWTNSHWVSVAARRAKGRTRAPAPRETALSSLRWSCVHCGLPFGAPGDPEAHLDE